MTNLWEKSDKKSPTCGKRHKKWQTSEKKLQKYVRMSQINVKMQEKVIK